MKNIMFIAPPAAGKGTQAEKVVEEFNIPHISTGEILRDVSKEDSEVGHYVLETLKSGNLVKDEITYQLVKERLQKDDCKNGYIIDGFPRNIEQAKEYDRILNELEYEVGNVILVDVSEETLAKRITGRRLCEDCGTAFNLNIDGLKPQVESVCDKCGGKLYQRSDDNLESFNTRYNTYKEKTEPIIDYYAKKGVLKKVDGDRPVEEVYKDVRKIISA